jgi:DNA-binding transcriptional LysR family regulator
VLNVGRLRVLRELHHRKTLSAVAEALSYSTSAVSQQVRLLEKEVGVPLVEPIGRRLKLTPQGLTLVGHAEKILDMLERAEADVSSSMEQPSGVVKIAAFQTAAMTFLPRVAQELQNLHP